MLEPVYTIYSIHKLERMWAYPLKTPKNGMLLGINGNNAGCGESGNREDDWP